MVKSFFEKLKKGMGIELPIQEELEKEQELEVRETEIENQNEEKEEIVVKKTRKKAIKKKPKKKTISRQPKPRISKKEILKTKQIKDSTPKEKEDWLESEGQLLVDVYQTKNELVIQSAIAGIKPKELDIVLENDLITIRGNRKKLIEEQGDYFTKECYWGRFSREIILPVEIDPNHIKVSMKEGILVIRIPKILREKKKEISVEKIGE